MLIYFSCIRQNDDPNAPNKQVTENNQLNNEQTQMNDSAINKIHKKHGYTAPKQQKINKIQDPDELNLINPDEMDYQRFNADSMRENELPLNQINDSYCRLNEVNINGKCSCKPGFIHGSKMCYKCISQCPQHSKCVEPGHCKCDEGYAGENCDKLQPPVIVSFSPMRGASEGGTTVNISYTYPMQVNEGHCKFGNFYVKARSVDRNTIVCVSPAQAPKSVPISISFDMLNWGKSDLLFEFVNKGDLRHMIPIIASSIICVFVCVIFALKCMKSRFNIYDDGEYLLEKPSRKKTFH